MPIEKLVQEITSEAVKATLSGKALVSVEYSGYVNMLEVYAYPAGTIFKEGVPRSKLFKLGTYLDDDSCITTLREMLYRIQDLK